MHAIEELSEPPYLLGDDTTYEIKDSDGTVFEMPVRNHNFDGWAQRYDRLEQILDIHTGNVLAAECHLVEASAMWQAAHDKLKDDPLFFVDRVSDDISEIES